MRGIKIDYLCTNCGYEGELIIDARESHKTMSKREDYCANCNSKQELLIFNNLDEFKSSLKFRDDLTEEEKLVLELTSKDKNAKTR